jgi:hypothetical protein
VAEQAAEAFFNAGTYLVQRIAVAGLAPKLPILARLHFVEGTHAFWATQHGGPPNDLGGRVRAHDIRSASSTVLHFNKPASDEFHGVAARSHRRADMAPAA